METWQINKNTQSITISGLNLHSIVPWQQSYFQEVLKQWQAVPDLTGLTFELQTS